MYGFLKENFNALLMFALIGLAGIYFGNLLFSSNSISVLVSLQNKQRALNNEVERLREQNATLQKELFELRGLEPQSP